MKKIIVFLLFIQLSCKGAEHLPPIDITRLNQELSQKVKKSEDILVDDIVLMQNSYLSMIKDRQYDLNNLYNVEQNILGSLNHSFGRYNYMLAIPISIDYASQLLQNYKNNEYALLPNERAIMQELDCLLYYLKYQPYQDNTDFLLQQVYQICSLHKDLVYQSLPEYVNYLNFQYCKQLKEQDIACMTSVVNNCNVIIDKVYDKKRALVASSLSENASISLDIQDAYQEEITDLNKLSYSELMDKKLLYQQQSDQIKALLIEIDKKIISLQAHIQKDSLLFGKVLESINLTKQNVSFDTAYAILKIYEEKDRESSLTEHEQRMMFHLNNDLKVCQKYIDGAISKYKNIGISQILSMWPCSNIIMNIKNICLDYQQKMLALYQNNIEQYQDQLHDFSEQKILKTKEQSFVKLALVCIDELSPNLLIQHNQKILKDVKAITLLQSLYRMKLVKKRQDVVNWRKSYEIKQDIVKPIVDNICDNVFSVIQRKEYETNVAIWKDHQLLEQIEFKKVQDEKKQAQKEEAKQQELLKNQELAALKKHKAEQRKIQRQIKNNTKKEIITKQQVIQLALFAKNAEENDLLERLSLENRRKNMQKLITLADNNIQNIKDVCDKAITMDQPLNRIMGMVVFYVENFGLSDFDKKKFFNSLLQYVRDVKAHNFVQNDSKKRSIFLEQLMQQYFESLIYHQNSCVAHCSDEQAANLAKLHNLLVDFIEAKFDFSN